MLGANGAGKSTLLKAIAGLVPHLRGSAISLGSRDAHRLPPHEIVEAGVALVPEGRGIFSRADGAREPDARRLSAPRPGARRRRTATSCSRCFPRLAERMGQAVRTMSGGEQQMVAIGRALMSAPELLLLDEPSLGLSPLLAHELFQALARIRETGVGVLLVEQNARQSLRIADRGYLIETGRIVGEGRADRLAADPAVREAYLGVAGHATLVPVEAIEIEALAGPEATLVANATANLPLAGRSRSAKPISGGVAAFPWPKPSRAETKLPPTRNRFAISTSPKGQVGRRVPSPPRQFPPRR